jgi:transposase
MSRARTKKQKRAGQGGALLSLNCIEPNAAGIDVGATEIFVAVPQDRDPSPVRSFETFTQDLHRLKEWLQQCRITTIAMESTGVYWIPLFQILEEAGLEVCLVNAQHVKHVPGRKSDVIDCQWLQYLHSVGLLRASFRPEDRVCIIRSLLRHRDSLVQMAAAHVQHMQKALTQMNLQIHICRYLVRFCTVGGLPYRLSLRKPTRSGFLAKPQPLSGDLNPESSN